MALEMRIGGAIGALEEGEGTEVAGLLDAAFAADSGWQDAAARLFADLRPQSWREFRRRAVEALGPQESSNLQALGDDGRGVFLPAHVQTASFPLTRGGSLRCASLPGLRRELALLADRWGLPDDEAELQQRLPVGEGASELTVEQTYCLLTLAANEAVRRDCPLWLVGGPLERCE